MNQSKIEIISWKNFIELHFLARMTSFHFNSSSSRGNSGQEELCDDASQVGCIARSKQCSGGASPK